MGYFSTEIKWNWKGKTGGWEVFETAANEFLRKLENKAPLFEATARQVAKPAVQEQFASEGSEGGHAWQELKEVTVKKRGSAHPILDETGHLRESFEEGASDHVEEFLPDSGFWGSEAQQAVPHQTGFVNHWGGRFVVARPILFWNEQMRQKAEQLLKEFAAKATEGIFHTGNAPPDSGAFGGLNMGGF